MTIQKLKLDKKFQPCIAGADDEIFHNGIFSFNITKMTDFIYANKDHFFSQTIDVKSLRRGSSANLIEDAIAKAQLSNPIILAEISPERYNVIDGNHRLERAFRDELQEITAYKLTVSQHHRFLISTEAYEAYVRYWNQKAAELKR